MEPQELLRLLRKWAMLVVVLAVVGASVAFVVSESLTPVYEAEGRLLVLAAPQQQSQGGGFSSTIAQVTSTYASLMTTNPVLQQLITDMHLPESPEQLARKIKVTPERDTQILSVAVSDPSAQRATDIDNTLMSDFVSQVSKQHQDQIAQATADLRAAEKTAQDDITSAEQSIAAIKPGDKTDPAPLLDRIRQDREQLTQLVTAYSTSSATQSRNQDNVTPASPARIPSSPSSPRILLNTVIGGLAGVLVGIGLVLVFEYLDQGLRSEDDVRRRLGLTTLGVIPNFSTGSRRTRTRRGNERAAEAYRRLRTNLRFCAVDKPIRSVVVTSSRQAEGKTSTSANLARFISASGLRVLLVDADMRRPSQHTLFSKPLLNGMSELLLGVAQGREPSVNGSHATDHRNLSLLTAGVIPPNPAELLASRHAPEVLHGLEETHDLVVIDTPPVDVVTDALGLAASAGATILVVKAGGSARVAQRTIDALQHVGANVVGVVLNRAQEDKAAGYYYYYGYAAGREANGNGAAPAAAGGADESLSAWQPMMTATPPRPGRRAPSPPPPPPRG